MNAEKLKVMLEATEQHAQRGWNEAHAQEARAEAAEARIAALEAERDAALKALNDVLENFRANNRKGIGMGPLLRARNVLNQYENYKIKPGDKV